MTVHFDPLTRTFIHPADIKRIAYTPSDALETDRAYAPRGEVEAHDINGVPRDMNQIQIWALVKENDDRTMAWHPMLEAHGFFQKDTLIVYIDQSNAVWDINAPEGARLLHMPPAEMEPLKLDEVDAELRRYVQDHPSIKMSPRHATVDAELLN